MRSRWSRSGFWLLPALLALGCAARAVEPNYAVFAATDPRNRPYLIGVSDVVRITVWRDPSLSTETAVRPDGAITVPLAGEIGVAGRTTNQVKEQLERRLSAYLKEAVVTVAVVEVNSYRFTVAGNVEHPGMFTPRYYVTVAEAVALAGGPNRYASPAEIVLIRPRASQSPARIPINYPRILSGERPDQNIVVLAGDTVQVP